MRPGVIFDRDGTLVDFVRDEELGVVTPAFHPDQLRLLPGVVAGLDRLSRAGFAIAIATNQPGCAKGELTREAIARTNDALRARLAGEAIAVAAFEVCLHHPTGGERGDPSLVRACDCRKPAPGMLTRIMAALELDPTRSWMMGDTAVDLAAARAAGLRAALLAPTARCELCPLARAPAAPAPDLWGARLDLLAEQIIEAG